MRGIKLIVRIFSLLLASSLALAKPDPLTLQIAGNTMRLQGDYAGAEVIYQRLIEEYAGDSTGYVFNLNSLLTKLTWNPRNTEYDQQIRSDADAALAICERAIASNAQDHGAYYHCGQTHLIMSYLSAMRGEYYQSGRHGNLAIKQLEKTLALDPTLIEAKMHLGVAYYYADNLPPFLKILSWFLWIIPRGNADKSFLYLEQVVVDDGAFSDVAKYIYADLLAGYGTSQKKKATDLLLELSKDYPGNKRFQLRYISLLLEQQLHQQTISAGKKFLHHSDDDAAKDLVHLWITRAHLALGQHDQASSSFHKIDTGRSKELPPWGLHWLLLTQGQLADLNDNQPAAINAYQQIIELSKIDYVSSVVIKDAERGLQASISK